MNKEEDNKTTRSIYPTATRGPLSTNHSDYGTQRKWSGKEPDKHIKLYVVIIISVLVVGVVVYAKSLKASTFGF